VSSGYAAAYTYVDREAEERRRKRGVVADLQAELATLKRQCSAARSMGCGRLTLARPAEPRDTASSAELDAAISDLRSAADQARAALDSALDEHWSGRLQRDAARRAKSRARQAAAGATAAGPVVAPLTAPRQATPTPRRDVADERDRALEEMRETLARYAPRCLPDDLATLDAQVGELAACGRVEEVRAKRIDIDVLVAASIERAAQAQRLNQIRARLRALAAEAPAAERAGLRRAIESAPDPMALEGEVRLAAKRGTAVRKRGAVAGAAVRALRDIGCAVPAEANAVLAAGGDVIAPLADSAYGVYIRFNAERDDLATALVRRADRPADPALDTAAQQRFCDTGLPVLTAGLADAGVGLREYHRIEPGLHAPGAVDAAAWITTARPHHDDRADASDAADTSDAADAADTAGAEFDAAEYAEAEEYGQTFTARQQQERRR
jgi:hypothetical protein